MQSIEATQRVAAQGPRILGFLSYSVAEDGRVSVCWGDFLCAKEREDGWSLFLRPRLVSILMNRSSKYNSAELDYKMTIQRIDGSRVEDLTVICCSW